MTKYTPDREAGHSLPLNQKVSRVASSLLARLSWSGQDTDSLELSEEAVEEAIRAWRDRSLYLPGELFSDVAWGMLLELLHAEVMRKPIPVTMLCRGSGVSMASSGRWLRVMESRGLVARRAEPFGSANEIIELTPKASQAMRQYFRDVLGSQ